MRHIFPKKPYVNLEAHDIQEMARLDPQELVGEKYLTGAVVYGGVQEQIIKSIKVLNYKHVAQAILS